MSTLVAGIAELVTNDPARSEGPLGLITEAALVVEDGVVAWIGPAASAPPADTRLDVEGRAVVPGFVDSHAHLVFAGDRSAEFEARMAGTPYDGGGIASTVAATRAAGDDQLRARLRGWSPRCAPRARPPWRSRAGTDSPSRTRSGRCGWPAR
jgi:imidazolonepropionase